MKFDQFKTIAIIAEGVPEKRARQLLWEAEKKNVLIIGPATVGKKKWFAIMEQLSHTTNSSLLHPSLSSLNHCLRRNQAWMFQDW